MAMIPEVAIRRKELIAKARCAILGAMQRFTIEQGGLTHLEWLDVFQVLVRYQIADALVEEFSKKPE